MKRLKRLTPGLECAKDNKPVREASILFCYVLKDD